MSDIAALSFFPSKNLGGFGDAGMVVTDNEKLAERIKSLRVHGGAIQYVHSEIGLNSRLDNLQAAVLRIKLKYLDKWLEARRQNAAFYNEKLKDVPVVFPYVPDYNVHTYHQYTLKVQGSGDRVQEKLLKHLSDNGVGSRVYYPIPLHLQDCYKPLGYKRGSMKVSETAAQEVFSIPIYPEMTSDQKAFVVDTISGFFR
jgi:dTDP-4-amino-4,6-dideoxygalactose transaminase